MKIADNNPFYKNYALLDISNLSPIFPYGNKTYLSTAFIAAMTLSLVIILALAKLSISAVFVRPVDNFRKEFK